MPFIIGLRTKFGVRRYRKNQASCETDKDFIKIIETYNQHHFQ